jgi:hypothetical protein
LEVTVLKKEEGLPKNRSCFFEEVMGKLKLRDIEADNRPQNTLEKNLHDFTVYTFLFRSINSLMPRLHAESL